MPTLGLTTGPHQWEGFHIDRSSSLAWIGKVGAGVNQPVHYTILNIIFSVVTTLSWSTLTFNSLIISVRLKCAATFPTTTSFLLLSLLVFSHILTNPKFVHVTSTHYHSWCLVFEFTFNTTYFHRVSNVYCMRLYLVYRTLNIIFSVVPWNQGSRHPTRNECTMGWFAQIQSRSRLHPMKLWKTLTGSSKFQERQTPLIAQDQRLAPLVGMVSHHHPHTNRTI